MKKQKAKQGAQAPAPKKEKKESEAPEAPAHAAASEAELAVEDTKPADDAKESPSPVQTSAPSLSQQSKIRSSSFRQGPLSPGLAGPISPDGETAPDIYRKHVARIEELEKENKRLGKDLADAEKRWQKAEEELADLREADGESTIQSGGGSDQVQKLVCLSEPSLPALPSARTGH